MINHYKKNGPWIWRCHIDLTNPNKDLWNYLVPTIEKYDAVIFSLKDYAKKLKTPEVYESLLKSSDEHIITLSH